VRQRRKCLKAVDSSAKFSGASIHKIQGGKMKYWIRAAVVLLALGAQMAGAEELFPDGKAAKMGRLTEVTSGTTMGGYPLYTGGRNWYLLDSKVESNNMDARIAYLQLVSPEGESLFAQMAVVASLSAATEDGYFSADLCSLGKSHLFMLNKAAGRNDNCLLIDPVEGKIGDKDFTLLLLKIRNSQSSWRLYDVSMYLSLEKLGFSGTVASDWTPSAVAADPRKQKAFDRIVAWAKQLQDGVNKAIAFAKPQNAFDGVPAIQTLVATD
jgi:hypothetical protein